MTSSCDTTPVTSPTSTASPDSDPPSRHSGRHSNAVASSASKCPICGDPAHAIHLRALCCRACAAFFRRTVCTKKQYTCTRGAGCHVNAVRTKLCCKFCRFQRCIRAGMSMNAVLKRRSPELISLSPDNPIQRVFLAQRSTFINRYRSHLKACGGDASLVRMGRDNQIIGNAITIGSEFSVLTEYLRNSGFLEFGLSQCAIRDLAKELFYTWVCYHSVMATLRNSGHKQRLAYFVDESYVRATEEDVEAYVSTYPHFYDYTLAARSTFRCLEEDINGAHALQKLRMEEGELALIFQIHALQQSAKLFPANPLFKYALNDLLAHLKRHYSENYDDVALRIGNMILMLSELNHWQRFLCEYVTELQLNGYVSVLEKMLNDPMPHTPLAAPSTTNLPRAPTAHQAAPSLYAPAANLVPTEIPDNWAQDAYAMPRHEEGYYRGC